MSTRSVIARQTGDGWEGRYIHNNGYPSWRLPELFRIHEAFKGDVAAMIRYYIDEHGAWSSIGEDIETPPGYAEPPQADNKNRCYCHGDRHEDVMDDWFRSHEDPDGLEWAYVLNDTGIAVFRATANEWLFVNVVHWGQELHEDEMANLQCGSNFEWCGHYAYVHFPEAEGTRYSTDVWLGRCEPSWNEITHVRKGGILYRLTGSGSIERTYSLEKGYGYSHRWFSTVEAPDGTKLNMFTVSIPKRGEPKAPRGIQWIFEKLPERVTA